MLIFGRLITFYVSLGVAIAVAWHSSVAAPNLLASFELPRNDTIAPNGEVTGNEHRPNSPAERLGLIGAGRAKHEKCLADAVYFEARGEPLRGQMAVAQVIINRVFSGYYPRNICGVVYQNAHRHKRCQFTFACDGRPERVDEPVLWGRAEHIARDALDGNFWLNDVGEATHYHARRVHPWWTHKMRKLNRIGVHTFYRPRNWGDGSHSSAGDDAQPVATMARRCKSKGTHVTRRHRIDAQRCHHPDGRIQDVVEVIRRGA
jgi:hypothetical protein